MRCFLERRARHADRLARGWGNSSRHPFWGSGRSSFGPDPGCALARTRLASARLASSWLAWPPLAAALVLIRRPSSEKPWQSAGAPYPPRRHGQGPQSLVGLRRMPARRKIPAQPKLSEKWSPLFRMSSSLLARLLSAASAPRGALLYGLAERRARAVSDPLASAASTVPTSRPE